MKEITIVGSGVAGLASAARLQAKGNSVTVFEANSYPGGKLSQIEQGDFRFDAGPSLFTVPHFLDQVFIDCGKDPRSYYNYQKVDPGCHYFWEDGTRFKAHSDSQKFSNDAEQTFGVPAERIEKHIQKCEDAYDITEDVFLKSSLHKASTYLKKSTLLSFLQLNKAKVFSTLNDVNESGLKNDKLVQLFNRYATYNGSNPYKAPGTLMVIPTLEHRWGTFLPEGGMHNITSGLYNLCLDLGVKFRFEERVKKLETANDQVKKVITDQGTYEIDLAISNMDIYPTYNHLIPEYKIPKRIESQERSSSALIFYWGMNTSFSELGLHNIFWSNNYRKEFDLLFDSEEPIEDPTVYVNITSKHVAGDAPEGCENWFVMINAPKHQGQNWDELASRVRSNIIEKLNRILNRNIEENIVNESILTPAEIERKTSSYRGSLYGTSSNSMLAAFFRHPNFHRKIKNLFFCGGSVHPGGGIPLCLLSAQITSDLINE